jgi:hypothetical protein
MQKLSSEPQSTFLSPRAAYHSSRIPENTFGGTYIWEVPVSIMAGKELAEPSTIFPS